MRRTLVLPVFLILTLVSLTAIPDMLASMDEAPRERSITAPYLLINLPLDSLDAVNAALDDTYGERRLPRIGRTEGFGGGEERTQLLGHIEYERHRFVLMPERSLDDWNALLVLDPEHPRRYRPVILEETYARVQEIIEAQDGGRARIVTEDELMRLKYDPVHARN